MVRCAVCGRDLSTHERPLTLEYEGKTYYFCCPCCLNAFRQNPRKYIGASSHPSSCSEAR